MRSILWLPLYTWREKKNKTCSQVLSKLPKVTLHLNNKADFKFRAVRLQNPSLSHHKTLPRARDTKSPLLNRNHWVFPMPGFPWPQLLTSSLVFPSWLAHSSHSGTLPSPPAGRARSCPRSPRLGRSSLGLCIAQPLSSPGALLKCRFLNVMQSRSVPFPYFISFH